MKFKDALKQVMDENDISASALSIVTGIGKSSISMYLSGKHEPNEKRKRQIAEAVGLPADYFLVEQVTYDVDRIYNVPVQKAAKILGQGERTVRQALKDGVAPYGYAVKRESGQWQYYISPHLLEKLTGIDVNKGAV